MPSAVLPNYHAGSPAPDNDIFNYDAAVDDFLKDLPLDNDGQDNTTAKPAKDIDEEITVKKQRKPVPKLDADRLLSQNGITKLRRVTKSRLKFRGKGHEFSDISGLLNVYQLWLDDLFPRAKFRDALVLVEKVGHSKRMQVMRKAWLDDTKPHRRDASPDAFDDVVMSGALPGNEAEEQARNSTEHGNDNTLGTIEGRQTQLSPDENEPGSDNAPADDELDALLAENHTTAPLANKKTATKRGPFDDDSDEDELDALLAGEGLNGSGFATSGRNEPVNTEAQRDHVIENDFADEEEIMRGMDMW